MDILVRLDDLLGRASKLSEGHAKEASTLLLSFYTDAGDKTKLADYLMRFKSTVCLFFFEDAVKVLKSDSQLQSIHSAICSTESYKNNKNHVATSRGFIISAVLIKNEISIARATLMRTIADVEKDGKFSDAVINIFKQYVLDYCGSLEQIKMLGEKPWSKPEGKYRFLRFMEVVSASIVTIVSPAKEKDDSNVSHTSVVSDAPVLHAEEEKSISSAGVADNFAIELMETLSSASREANILLKTLSDANGIIASLNKTIADKDSRIKELMEELNEKSKAIVNLQREFDKSQKSVRDSEERIADLSERLKNSLQMDSISQNQELITLRTNIQNSLKVEYADFIISKESECTPDTYGALIGSLTRIFKTLRRYGITID